MLPFRAKETRSYGTYYYYNLKVKFVNKTRIDNKPSWLLCSLDLDTDLYQSDQN